MPNKKHQPHKHENKSSAPVTPTPPVNRIDRPADRSRRALMLLGSLYFFDKVFPSMIGSLFGNILAPPVAEGIKHLRPQSNTDEAILAGPSAMAPRNSTEIAKVSFPDLRDQLFLRSLAPTSFVPPGDWMTPEGKVIPPQTPVEGGLLTYGHEAAVLKSISTFLNRERGVNWRSTDVGLNLPRQYSEIILGSGQSNQRTRDFLGSPQMPKNPFYYTIREEPTMIERFQYGKWIKAHRKVVCNSAGEIVASPRDDKGKLVDDYLLVTRLPGEGNTTITIFSGLHGPGTRVTEKFFTAERLEWLHNLAGFIEVEDETEVPHFQAIFRASEFQKGEDDTDSHVAAKLELLTGDRSRPRRIVRV